MKKYILTIIYALICLSLLHLFPQNAYSQTVLKGKISTVIKKGEVLKINIKTPINFYFSLPGDKVTAIIPNEIKIGEYFYIPKGSNVEGIITEIKKPERFGQGGAFEIDFTKIITPENISIPIHASISTDTTTVTEKFTKTLTYDSALITYGTLHGALAGIQYGGIPLAVSSHGISVLTGAGVGTTFGIIGSVVRKGEIPTASIIKPVEVLLKSNFNIFGDLPEMPQKTTEEKSDKEYTGFRFSPPFKKDDLKIEIKKVEKKQSKTLGEYLSVNFIISNSSNKNFNLSNLALINKTNNEDVIYADIILSGIELLKSVKPSESLNSSLAFIVSKKENYDLVIIDPLDNKEIVRIPLKEK